MPFSKCSQQRQRGVSLITTMAAFAIVAGAFTLYLSSTARNHASVRRYQDLANATQFATELIELFRSMSSTQMNTYLFTNAAKFTAGNVPLCAHINILDRSSGTIVNPDVLATLPPNPLDRTTPATNSNRYYQVNVVDATSLAINTAACNGTVPYVFGANERFLVTVSVTFIPIGKTVASVERAVVSTLLAEP